MSALGTGREISISSTVAACRGEDEGTRKDGLCGGALVHDTGRTKKGVEAAGSGGRRSFIINSNVFNSPAVSTRGPLPCATTALNRRLISSALVKNLEFSAHLQKHMYGPLCPIGSEYPLWCEYVAK